MNVYKIFAIMSEVILLICLCWPQALDYSVDSVTAREDNGSLADI